MNHFISGIIKIVLLEASVGLLVVDLVAGQRFERRRAHAAGALALLMVYAWANYGALRSDTHLPYALSAVPLVLACAWLVQAAFGTTRSPRMEAFGAWAARLHPTFGPRLAGAGLAALLAVGWVANGVGTGAVVLVHPWEQFHFYLGAKYQREVGWFNLYKAAILADRETINALASATTTRDLRTFDEVPIPVALLDAAQVRARFSDEAWAAFKADWATYARTFPVDWGRAIDDHGNSNSPAWSILAHPIASLVPISREGNAALGWLDLLLMLGLWLFVWQTFGHRASAQGLLLWAAPPLVFDYLAGSFLRWDWLFALGLSACFLERRRPATAGALLGYAVASKLFPLFFGVGLLLREAFVFARTRRLSPGSGRFLAGALVSGTVCVLVAGAMFGFSAWVEYAQRIEVAQLEKFYSIQYSLKTVYLQYAAGSWPTWSQGLFPAELMQARREVDIADHALGFLLVRLAFTFAIAQLARRASQVEAFLLGPLLVFTWLTVNMYYWNMLGLLALGLFLRRERSRPALALLIALHAILMFFYLYQHLNRGFAEGFAVASLLAVAIVGAGVWEWRLARVGVG
jgi:hypothetical protein